MTDYCIMLREVEGVFIFRLLINSTHYLNPIEETFKASTLTRF